MGYLDDSTDLRSKHAVQREVGADIALLDPAALARRFPWLATDDLALASLGLSGEGWFDGPALLQTFRRKAIAYGARIIAAEAVGFDSAGDCIGAAVSGDGRRFAADAFVLAAGAWSAPLAAALGVALPVHAKKRDVFVFDSPAVLAQCPLVVDHGGLWFWPDGPAAAGGARGARYLAGAPPREPWPGGPDEPPLHEIDHGLFDEVIWPALAARVPVFEALRIRSAWPATTR